MLESLMLGQIPGTEVQVSFYGWLFGVAIVLFTVVATKVFHRNWQKIIAGHYGRKALRLLSQHRLL